MRTFSRVLCNIAVLPVVTALLLPHTAVAQVQTIHRAAGGNAAASGQALELNVMNSSGDRAHILPTHDQIKSIAALNNGGTPPLLYHGGPVMHTPAVYAIFWIPPHLQDGSATSLSAAYQKVQTTMLSEYFGHSLMNNNTQYYDALPKTKWITNSGKLGGTYVDTSLYPGADCSDPGVPVATNCITDADIQAEVTKVMGIKGWTGGVSKLFMVFTSLNEGSCFSSGSSSCSYTAYCAYHGAFVNGLGADVVYSNEPYGNLAHCQVGGAPSPNTFPEADAAATAASHELTESITDPLLDAWFDSSGFEIGDECAYYYGFAGWDGGLANEQWDGHPFYLQTEYSNVLKGWSISASFPGCFNAGPDL